MLGDDQRALQCPPQHTANVRRATLLKPAYQMYHRLFFNYSTTTPCFWADDPTCCCFWTRFASTANFMTPMSDLIFNWFFVVLMPMSGRLNGCSQVTHHSNPSIYLTTCLRCRCRYCPKTVTTLCWVTIDCSHLIVLRTRDDDHRGCLLTTWFNMQSSKKS